jgi:hypothetical protein
VKIGAAPILSSVCFAACETRQELWRTESIAASTASRPNSCIHEHFAETDVTVQILKGSAPLEALEQVVEASKLWTRSPRSSWAPITTTICMNHKWAGSHLKAAVKELLSLSQQFCSQIWGAEKQLGQQSCWIGKTNMCMVKTLTWNPRAQCRNWCNSRFYRCQSAFWIPAHPEHLRSP